MNVGQSFILVIMAAIGIASLFIYWGIFSEHVDPAPRIVHILVIIWICFWLLPPLFHLWISGVL